MGPLDLKQNNAYLATERLGIDRCLSSRLSVPRKKGWKKPLFHNPQLVPQLQFSAWPNVVQTFRVTKLTISQAG